MIELGRGNWIRAEELAREAVDLSLNLDRKEQIALDYACLAQALVRRGQKHRGLQYAQKAVDLLRDLKGPRSHDVAWAESVLKECLDDDQIDWAARK